MEEEKIEINRKFYDKNMLQKLYPLKSYENMTNVQMKYEFECGCKMRPTTIWMDVTEFAMSSSICIFCPNCKLLNEAKKIEPEVFYIPLTRQEFSLNEFMCLEFPDSWQKPFLELFKQKAIENSKKKGNFDE